MSNLDAPRSFHEFEEAGWSQPAIAENYDRGFGRLTTQVVPALLDAVELREGEALLDVATGPGYVAEEALKRGGSVTGIDFSPSMVAIAAHRFPAADFRQGDAHNLHFPSGRFDAVTINFGLLHFERPERALGEALRVLKPGGRIGFTAWAGPQKTRALGLLLDAIRLYGNPNVPLPEGTPFFRFSDHLECRRILESAGFRQARVMDIEQYWEFASAEELMAALEEGTVRNSAMLKSQSPDQLERIRRAYADSLAEFAGPDRSLRVPMPAVLASGRKP